MFLNDWSIWCLRVIFIIDLNEIYIYTKLKYKDYCIFIIIKNCILFSLKQTSHILETKVTLQKLLA